MEWAPRRAPLRVRRGADGYLDVYEPSAPHRAIDIPKERWITIAAQEGDATEAIRNAFSSDTQSPYWIAIGRLTFTGLAAEVTTLTAMNVTGECKLQK